MMSLMPNENDSVVFDGFLSTSSCFKYILYFVDFLFLARPKPTTRFSHAKCSDVIEHNMLIHSFSVIILLSPATIVA